MSPSSENPPVSARFLAPVILSLHVTGLSLSLSSTTVIGSNSAFSTTVGFGASPGPATGQKSRRRFSRGRRGATSPGVSMAVAT